MSVMRFRAWHKFWKTKLTVSDKTRMQTTQLQSLTRSFIPGEDFQVYTSLIRRNPGRVLVKVSSYTSASLRSHASCWEFACITYESFCKNGCIFIEIFFRSEEHTSE